MSSMERESEMYTFEDVELPVDSEGFISIGDFATQILGRQSKSIVEFLDPSREVGEAVEGLRTKNVDPGNYQGWIHKDDLPEFVQRVREHYGEK